MASIKEQVEASIANTKYDLVKKYYKDYSFTPELFTKVFDATISEAKKYVENNYKIDDLIHTVENRADGFYALRRDGYWQTYLKDREAQFNEENVQNESEIWERYIKDRLGITKE